jgi:porin
MRGISSRIVVGTLALVAVASVPPVAGASGNEAVVDGPARHQASGGWFGVRSALARHGVEVTLSAQADPSANLAGGVRRGAVVRVPLQAALDVDTGALLGWPGGHVHAGVQALRGRHGSDLLVGDAQGFDNVDAASFDQVSEVWIEQRLAGDRLRLKAGKADANADFARVEHGGGFLNSSAGYSPTIQGFPSYPDPAMSVSLKGSPSSWLVLGAGLYDGATREGCHGRTGNRGAGTFFGAPSASFLVAEARLRFAPGGLPGRFTVGAWRHTGSFRRFDGATQRGTAGWYAVAEQRLAQEPGDAAQGLGMFAQLGTADRRLSRIERHFSLGLAATGALPGRDRDVLGVMVSSAVLSAGRTVRGGRLETAIEMYYGVEVRPWLAVQPDVQLILNPGARGASDALVCTLRVGVSF